MMRAELVATVALPAFLGLALLMPRPGGGASDADGRQPASERLYAWSCGGIDAHAVPSLVFEVRAPRNQE